MLLADDLVKGARIAGGGKGGRLIIAIDGPAGAGKSTVARRLARQLGYTYLDTGAMYRAAAWRFVQEGVTLDDEKALEKILRTMNIELKEDHGDLKVFLDGEDITDEIRTPELSQVASKISAFRVVRDKLVQLQRAMGLRGGVVAEGRDIGTVVFPEAQVKIYLDASSHERARRRFEELRRQGLDVTLEATRVEIDQRDQRDKERALAPLSRADDAVFIDSTSLDVDAVLELIMKQVKMKLETIH